MNTTHYVYTLAYPDGIVFYVGKGSGRRLHHHETDAKKGHQCQRCEIIRQIWGDSGQIIKTRVQENLSKEDAFILEARLIKMHGYENLANRQRGHKQACDERPKRKYQRREKAPVPQFECVLSVDEFGKYSEEAIFLLKSHFNNVFEVPV